MENKGGRDDVAGMKNHNLVIKVYNITSKKEEVAKQARDASFAKKARGAVTLQKMARGLNVRQERAKQEEAAVKLQALNRGRMGRERLASTRAQVGRRRAEAAAEASNMAIKEAAQAEEEAARAEKEAAKAEEAEMM